MEENPTSNGTLYIVSTPIGNDDDITVRALKILKSCDLVVCEEAKEGAKLLKVNKISKDIVELNEHNENENTPDVLEKLRAGKNVALISDAGTPILADPGLILLKEALKENLPIEVIPGVSSILTALVRSGFSANQFLYAGFLSRKPNERIEQLEQLSRENRTVVVLDTPYRLKAFLGAAAEVMPERRAYIGCNLTMPFETHHYGTFSELQQKFEEKNFRGEFVICFEGAESAAAAKPKRGRKKSSASEKNSEEKLEKNFSETEEILEVADKHNLLELDDDEFDADEAEELMEEAGIDEEGEDSSEDDDDDQPKKRPRIKREAPPRRERGGTSGVYSSTMQSGSYGDDSLVDRSAMRTEGYQRGGRGGRPGGPRGAGQRSGSYGARSGRPSGPRREFDDNFGNRKFDDREGGYGRGRSEGRGGGFNRDEARPGSNRRNFGGGGRREGGSLDQPPRRRDAGFGDGPRSGGGFAPRGDRPQRGGGGGFAPRGDRPEGGGRGGFAPRGDRPQRSGGPRQGGGGRPSGPGGRPSGPGGRKFGGGKTQGRRRPQ